MILDTLDQQRAAVYSEKTVYLFCDSISGIEAVNNPNSSLSSYNITRLNRMCQQFSTSGVKINLLHIPGHTGIPGNTTADTHAKDTAYKIFKGEIAAPLNVSISTAFTVAGDIVKKSWQMTMGSRTNWTLYLQPDTSGQQQSPLSTSTWYWHFLLQVTITWYHAKVWQSQIRHIWLLCVTAD